MGKISYTVKDVEADGDCFFRALYNSAKESGNLQVIKDKLLNGKKIDEESFIIKMRKRVAYILRRAESLKEVYYHIRDIYRENPENYETILESFPDWFVKNFSKPPSQFKEFKKLLAKNVEKPKNWVSEIEVTLILKTIGELLKPNRKIIILNKLPYLDGTGVLKQHNITLFNTGEVHYKYIVRRT